MTVKDLISELSKFPQGANVYKFNRVGIDSYGSVYLYHLSTPEEIAKEQRLMDEERERKNKVLSKERRLRYEKWERNNKEVASGKERQNMHISDEEVDREFDRYMTEKIRKINHDIGI